MPYLLYLHTIVAQNGKKINTGCITFCGTAHTAISKKRKAKHMNELEFYKMLYKKTDSGYGAVTDLLPKVQDPKLRHDMALHMEGYRHFSHMAKEHLAAANQKGEKRSAIGAIPARLGMMVNTMFNTSREHIAELMIHASNANILDLHRTMNRLEEHKGTEEAVTVCERVIDFEQDNIKRMQKYI
jgi:hypothetical protein